MGIIDTAEGKSIGTLYPKLFSKIFLEFGYRWYFGRSQATFKTVECKIISFEAVMSRCKALLWRRLSE